MKMDKETIFEWIVKVIATCNNDFHFEGVDRLIELFNERYNDADDTLRLQLLKVRRWNEIHVILT